MYWFERVLDKSERRLGRFAVPHLPLFLVLTHAAVYVFSLQWPEYLDMLLFNARLIGQGQVWRLVTYVFIPPTRSPLFMFFALYFMYLIARVLETQWGVYRFNCFYVLGMLATTLIGFLLPDANLTGAYLHTTLFLAFATLNPDFMILVFFIIPVKVKYLALLTWAGIAATVLLGSLLNAAVALISVGNYLLFFWPQLRDNVVYTRRSFKQAEPLAAFSRPTEAFHRCAVCGRTERDDAALIFRVCSSCKQEFCREHLAGHTHAAAAVQSAP